MALVTKDTIKAYMTERPYLVSVQTTDRDVQSAFFDVMEAYVNKFLPDYSDAYEVYDETSYNTAVGDLTFARLLYADIMKAGYAVVRARHNNTSVATNDEQRKSAFRYRRMGVARLELLRDLNKLTEDVKYVPILGEEI